MKFLLLLSLLAIPGLSHADDPFENTIHTEADGLFRVGPANAPFGPALAPNAEGVWTISLTDAFRYGLSMGRVAGGRPPRSAGPNLYIYRSGFVSTAIEGRFTAPISPSRHDQAPAPQPGNHADLGVAAFQLGPMPQIAQGLQPTPSGPWASRPLRQSKPSH